MLPLLVIPVNFFRSACFWFSLPLSIWLGSRQVGLLLHWQVLSSEAPAIRRRSPGFHVRQFPPARP